tara:strand:- start:593 stop:775 length:183 start_codon:yes stop_codon:yes gene_type:complete
MISIEEQIKTAFSELELIVTTTGGSRYSTVSGFKVELQYKGETITEDYLDGYDIACILGD